MKERYIDNEIIDRIKEETNIVDIVEGYLSLKKNGQNYKGLCPFHSEKTPSFVVNEGKQIFHCFGCGTGGNIFTFLMKIEGFTFTEAVRFLGSKIGIRIETEVSGNQGKKKEENKELFYNINKKAADYYQKNLLTLSEAKGAREYLRKRGIGDDIIREFSIGYALPLWDGLLREMKRDGCEPSLLNKAGLIVQREKGIGYYDRFRGRIILPIRSIHGEIAGFGGRVLDNSLPKYLNSPETALFSKKRELYALDGIRKRGKGLEYIVVVEGYFDAITAHQYGIDNVVATLGTALTTYHVQLIKRFSKRVVLIFDSDMAGVKAVQRTLDFLVGSGISVDVVSLPDGYDPDSFIRSKGRGEFLKLLEGSQKLLDFAIERSIKEIDINDIKERIGAADKMLPILQKIPNIIERNFYLKRLADKLDIDERILLEELQKREKRGNNNRYSYSNKTAGIDIMPKEEEILVHLIINNKIDREEIKEYIKEDNFTDKRLRYIVGTMIDSIEKSGEIRYEYIFKNELDAEISRLISSLSLKSMEYDDIPKTFNDCVKRLNYKRVQREKKEIERKIKAAEQEGNMDNIIPLQKEYLSLNTAI
ncbi:MAG: DNA primase [Nitrospirota bacterium]